MQAGRRVVAALALCVAALGAAAQEPNPVAPFITTPDEVVERMLQLAGTGPADTVIDLGSGDGRIVIAAARRFGARGIGVDIDPKLVALSRDRAREAGVAERTQFRQQDALRTDLSAATVVTVYLLPFLIDQLQPRFLDELKPGSRIVTHAFAMKGWRPDRSETVRLSKSHASQGDTSEIHLWVVPAQARGDWRAAGWRLRIEQNFQQIDVEAEAAGRALAVRSASLQGRRIELSGDGFAFRGSVDGGRISGELTRSGATSPLVFTKH